MKKRLLLLIMAIVNAICMTLYFAACGNEQLDTSTEDADLTNQLPNQPTHYEIDLTLSNFDKFINFTSNYTPYTNFEDHHELKGVLTYAYYENVTVTFYVEYIENGYNYDDIVYSGNFVINLDASGSNSFYANDAHLLRAINYTSYAKYKSKSRKVMLVGVSGRVIFSL